jgi:hypothetical protein
LISRSGRPRMSATAELHGATERRMSRVRTERPGSFSRWRCQEMALDRFSVMLRIADNEARLLERADQKAISMLSILGVFMVFFVVYYRIIPINFFTVPLMTIYFIFAAAAIWSLIMVVRPRVTQDSGEPKVGRTQTLTGDPTFFRGICKFSDADAYGECVEAIALDEPKMARVYARQIFALARINAAKYKHVQRGVTMVILSLATELIIIAYLFIFHMGEGRLPRIE